MKVIATKHGYFGRLREPGDTFDVPNGEKATWFEPVKDEAKGEAEVRRGQDESRSPTRARSQGPSPWPEGCLLLDPVREKVTSRGSGPSFSRGSA